MRIAVSGTHCMGKTTFIQDFLKIRPEYIYEEESYYQLQEKQGNGFSGDLTLEDFIEQLEYSLKQLTVHVPQQNIIFERCPIDFVAYAMYMLEQEGIHLEDTSIPERFFDIREALEDLDLLIFLPITKEYPIRCPDSEGKTFRKAVDSMLKQIFREELFDLLPSYDHPQIIEIWGSPEERIKKLEEKIMS